jgi:hypothetical protein
MSLQGSELPAAPAWDALAQVFRHFTRDSHPCSRAASRVTRRVTVRFEERVPKKFLKPSCVVGAK